MTKSILLCSNAQSSGITLENKHGTRYISLRAAYCECIMYRDLIVSSILGIESFRDN